MRYSLRFRSSYLCGTNVHTTIDLHGITGYHFAMESMGNSDGQPGFAAGRWPKYDDKQRLIWVIHTKLYAP